MEKMTDKEMATLRELPAKAKRIDREKKKLMNEADQIKDELLERWGIETNISDKKEETEQNPVWENICAAYGIEKDDNEGRIKLYNHLISQKQVSYYSNYCKK